MYKEFRHRTINISLMGLLSKDNMKEISKIKKENEKYQKQIEKYLKKTVDCWDYYWDGCDYISHLDEKVDGELKTLVKYDNGENLFTFNTLDGDKILEALNKKLENNRRKIVIKNNRLRRLLKDIKNFLGEK